MHVNLLPSCQIMQHVPSGRHGAPRALEIPKKKASCAPQTPFDLGTFAGRNPYIVLASLAYAEKHAMIISGLTAK